MMDDLERLLVELTSQDSDRLWVVQQLDERWNGRVRDAFHQIVDNPCEDENVRIEVLKAIASHTDLSDDPGRLASSLVEVFQNDADDLIRSYAAMALRRFVDVEGVLESLEKIIGDGNEDIDIRYNALDAIESNMPKEACAAVLQRCSDAPNLGDTIR